MGNNCCTVTVTLLKDLKGDNQPAQVELVALQQVVTAALVLKAKVLEIEKTIM